MGDYYDDTPWLPLVLMKTKRMNICNTMVYYYLERSDSLVNAKSPEAIQRKIDGGLMLLDILTKQLTLITDIGVRHWYDRIIAHSAASLLTLVGINHFTKRFKYMQRLQQLKIYPLTICGATKKAKRKLRLINFCPHLFLWLVHVKKNINDGYTSILQAYRRND